MKLVVQILNRQLEILEKKKQEKTNPQDIKRIEKHISEIKDQIKELSKK
jgi:ferritin-like metal-binding protein YciE